MREHIYGRAFGGRVWVAFRNVNFNVITSHIVTPSTIETTTTLLRELSMESSMGHGTLKGNEHSAGTHSTGAGRQGFHARSGNNRTVVTSGEY
jgi:hypothetical protein